MLEMFLYLLFVLQAMQQRLKGFKLQIGIIVNRRKDSCSLKCTRGIDVGYKALI